MQVTINFQFKGFHKAGYIIWITSLMKNIRCTDD